MCERAAQRRCIPSTPKVPGSPPTPAEQPPSSNIREPFRADALIPLALIIAGALALFGLDALEGPIQTPLIYRAKSMGGLLLAVFAKRGLAPQ